MDNENNKDKLLSLKADASKELLTYSAKAELAIPPEWQAFHDELTLLHLPDQLALQRSLDQGGDFDVEMARKRHPETMRRQLQRGESIEGISEDFADVLKLLTSRELAFIQLYSEYTLSPEEVEARTIEDVIKMDEEEEKELEEFHQRIVVEGGLEQELKDGTRALEQEDAERQTKADKRIIIFPKQDNQS